MIDYFKQKLKEANRVKGVYLIILPALIIYLIFGVYPFLKTFQLSFFEWNGISPTMKFVGFRNYIDIIFSNKIWWLSVWHAVFIAIFCLIFQNSFALAIAVITDQHLSKGKGFYRTVFFIPPVLSVIVVGIIWRWIFNGNYGIFNYFLKVMGVAVVHLRAWLADPDTALLAVAVVTAWHGFGYAFVLFLAGLQGIPKELYEASQIDGANAWQQFINVTLPQLFPVCIIVSILTILGTMQAFALIISMTGGGPGFHTEVPITRIYKEAFESYHFGYATAMAVVLGLILMIVSFIQLRVSKKYEK
ncbi:MAG: sugar ABC transporter permease [Elusimicrobia bacterium]|nr:sugar ABC transporter permease [Elusimicrobiota bacterium]